MRLRNKTPREIARLIDLQPGFVICARCRHITATERIDPRGLCNICVPRAARTARRQARRAQESARAKARNERAKRRDYSRCRRCRAELDQIARKKGHRSCRPCLDERQNRKTPIAYLVTEEADPQTRPEGQTRTATPRPTDR